MAHGFKTGTAGGKELNFRVVGNPCPVSPGENTLWLATDTPITGWCFSPERPEEVFQGLAWIRTGASGAAMFNALSKQTLQVSPISAMQYDQGQWRAVDGRTYREGQWQDWVHWLYKEGRFFEAGGSLTLTGQGTFQILEDSVCIRSEAGGSGYIVLSKIQDLTPFTTLTFTGSSNVLVSGGIGCLHIGVMRELSGLPEASLSGAYPEGTYHLDISQLTGSYYVGFYIQGFTDYVNLTLKELSLK